MTLTNCLLRNHGNKSLILVLYKIPLVILLFIHFKLKCSDPYTFKYSMLFRISFLLAYLSVCVVADKKDGSLERFIKLTFGVSKASYLPLETNRFLQNGRIMENPSFKASQDIPEDDRAACNIGEWIAKSYDVHETEVIC